MFDNRDRTKADFAIDLVAFRGVTVSPTLKYNNDYYGLNPLNQEGLKNSRSISAGVDVGIVVNPDLSFAVSYYWEEYNQVFYSDDGNGVRSIDTYKEHVNTLTGVVHWAAVPDKLDIHVRYALSDGIVQQNCSICVVQGASAPSPYPTDKTLFQRVDATAVYKFDPFLVRQMGLKGDLMAKLRYTWERNSVINWQTDPMAPFMPATSTTDIWMAYNNPNYNVHMLAGSLIAIW
jgi:hypothetical protein